MGYVRILIVSDFSQILAFDSDRKTSCLLQKCKILYKTLFSRFSNKKINKYWNNSWKEMQQNFGPKKPEGFPDAQIFFFLKYYSWCGNTCQLNRHNRQWAVWGCPERPLVNYWMNSLSSTTAVTHTWLSEVGGEIKWPNSQYRYIRHGYCRWAYKILWGSQSTSDLRIFGVRKPISDVKTPKTSTSASAVVIILDAIPRSSLQP